MHAQAGRQRHFWFKPDLLSQCEYIWNHRLAKGVHINHAKRPTGMTEMDRKQLLKRVDAYTLSSSQSLKVLISISQIQKGRRLVVYMLRTQGALGNIRGFMS